MQQFSLLKLEVFSWNSPTSLIRTISRQTSSQISIYSLLNSTSKPTSQIQCKILHSEIILFTNNSQAILSIPYLAMLNLFPAPQRAIKRPPNFNSKAAIEPEFMANIPYFLCLYLPSSPQLFPHNINLPFDKLVFSPANPDFLPTHPNLLPANLYPSPVHLNILPTNPYLLQFITILNHFNSASNLSSPDQVMSKHHQGSISPIQLFISNLIQLRSECAAPICSTIRQLMPNFKSLTDPGKAYLPTPACPIYLEQLQRSISPIQLFISTLMQIRSECAAPTCSTIRQLMPSPM